MVFALAGDSTMTSERAINSCCKPKRPVTGEYVSLRYLKPNSLLKRCASRIALVVILGGVSNTFLPEISFDFRSDAQSKNRFSSLAVCSLQQYAHKLLPRHLPDDPAHLHFAKRGQRFRRT